VWKVLVNPKHFKWQHSSEGILQRRVWCSLLFSGACNFINKTFILKSPIYTQINVLNAIPSIVLF